MDLQAIVDALFGQLERVSGFGIRGIGIDPTNAIDDKPGFNCLLYASDLLAGQVLEAPERAYHEQLRLIYLKILEGMKPYTRSGRLRYCSSEPLTLAMNDEHACTAAGVQQQGDYFHVPPTNFVAVSRQHALGTGTPKEASDALDNWGYMIGTTPFFDPDNASHQAWISLALLPRKRVADIDDATFRRIAVVTQFGWGLSAGIDSTHVDTLKQTAAKVESMDWIRPL